MESDNIGFVKWLTSNSRTASLTTFTPTSFLTVIMLPLLFGAFAGVVAESYFGLSLVSVVGIGLLAWAVMLVVWLVFLWYPKYAQEVER